MTDTQTSTTLLRELGEDPANRKAWERFVDRYGPRICRWLRGLGARTEEAEDLTQEVFTRLVRYMKGFTYDRAKGNFRGYLRRMTQHVWADFCAEQKKSVPATGGKAFDFALEQVPAEDFSKQFEDEYELEVFEIAKAKVQLITSPRDWRIFCRLVDDKAPAANVARELGLKVGAVYMVKRRIVEKLEHTVKDHLEVESSLD